ncbi:hypothetical protein [Burkholderia cenocepacia]|uniref:Uncharacterized protein n=2 Tax=Burkholderia cenocepacia TaxID=95486 RepID=A0A1V2W4Q1_9BURK|nr:hypothetical protein [Burkholderia cenocepacia]MBR8248655.1 hypothetical protein [Burkholderia cenocepacia]MBR8288829.1 hypothetical protein [Burkholderia cenocepacia]MBR8497098.1 hypothetical protein [Burkholderia cenocepacia]ONJ13669.1 hypothetical protein A8D83_11925 [Burkholderia cenocepacia]ONJ30227.1 hypothetical protein A8D90_07285 [Burkholderia cenocepacia]
MNQKKAKALRKVSDNRKEYRALKRAAMRGSESNAKPLAEPHSQRTAEARAHAALPQAERNKPWRVGAAAISAKHPQRDRRPGQRSARVPNFDLLQDRALMRITGLGAFADAFMSAAASAIAGLSTRYQKRRGARGQ